MPWDRSGHWAFHPFTRSPFHPFAFKLTATRGA